MRRGDILTIAISGDCGKPRPAIVIQADRLEDTDSVLVCQVTTTHRDTPLYRLMIPVTPETGLRAVSYVMADKIFAVRRGKCGPVIGRLPDEGILALDEMLAVVIGLAD
jgi:mRNA interferase MazF